MLDWMIIKINYDLWGWGYSNIVMYGLNPTLKSYLKRYPEMGRILRRYNENKLDGTEEFPELPKNDIPIQ